MGLLKKESGDFSRGGRVVWRCGSAVEAGGGSTMGMSLGTMPEPSGRWDMSVADAIVSGRIRNQKMAENDDAG
jgi:hypothetical protein